MKKTEKLRLQRLLSWKSYSQNKKLAMVLGSNPPQGMPMHDSALSPQGVDAAGQPSLKKKTKQLGKSSILAIVRTAKTQHLRNNLQEIREMGLARCSVRDLATDSSLILACRGH